MSENPFDEINRNAVATLDMSLLATLGDDKQPPEAPETLVHVRPKKMRPKKATHSVKVVSDRPFIENLFKINSTFRPSADVLEEATGIAEDLGLPTRHCSKCDTSYPLTSNFFNGNGNGVFRYICKWCKNEKPLNKSITTVADTPSDTPEKPIVGFDASQALKDKIATQKAAQTGKKSKKPKGRRTVIRPSSHGTFDFSFLPSIAALDDASLAYLVELRDQCAAMGLLARIQGHPDMCALTEFEATDGWTVVELLEALSTTVEKGADSKIGKALTARWRELTGKRTLPTRESTLKREGKEDREISVHCYPPEESFVYWATKLIQSGDYIVQ